MLSRFYVKKKVEQYERRMAELFADCETASVESFDGTRIAYWTPRRIADEMYRRVKGSEFTIIPGGSHATPAENPEMINFRIALWLRTYFHELVEERAPAPARVPRKKPAPKRPRA